MARKRNLTAVDTYINQDRPNTNYSKTKTLGVKYPEQFAYVTYPTPFPVGAKITKATLSWVTWGEMPESGNHTFNVTPVTSAVPYTRMTYNTRPERDTTKTVTVTRSGPQPHRQVWEVDVSDWLQDVSDGEPWYGFRIGTSDTQQRWIYSRNNTAEGIPGPSLYVEWADNPDEPSDLAPNEGVVGTPKPSLSFSFVDYGGSNVLKKVQVQISRTTSFTSPMWSSGELTITDGQPVIKLASTSFPGAASGERLYYRIKAMDEDNLWSGWSPRAWFQYVPLESLTLLTPSPENPMFTDASPVISWRQTGVQTAWKITIFLKGRPEKTVYDTGIVAGSEQVHQIPKSVLRWDNRVYEMTLRTWDDEDRVRAPNSLPYNYMKIEVPYTSDASTVLPYNVKAEQIGKTPRIAVTWQRDATADEWQIVRAGPGMESVVLDQITHSEAILANGTYRYIDRTAPPKTDFWYTVRPVTNGRRTTGRRTDDFRFDVEAIWLMENSGYNHLCINGSDQGEWTLPENVTSHSVINSQIPVMVRELRSGYQGSISGTLITEEVYQPGLGAKDKYRRLMQFKTSGDTYRLVAGDQNIPVVLSDVEVYPTPHWDLRYECSFNFWQYDEIWWEEETS